MKVLDICMAPGGYTAAVLKFNPRASTFAITLPKDQGGHPIHIERSRLAGLQLLDVVSDQFAYKNMQVEIVLLLYILHAPIQFTRNLSLQRTY